MCRITLKKRDKMGVKKKIKKESFSERTIKYKPFFSCITDIHEMISGEGRQSV